MSELSSDQEGLRLSIQKSATIWALVAAGITGVFVYWLLRGQEPLLRTGVTWAIGAAAGYLAYQVIFRSRAKSARCEKCSATFSIRRSNRQETQVSREEKEQRENQDDGSSKVNRWTEEKFDVVDSYECSNCQNVTSKEYPVTRRKDEQSFVELDHKVEVIHTKSGSGTKKAKGKSARKPRTKPKKNQ